MIKYGLILLVAFFVTISHNEVTALKCWRCSTDATDSNFCDDPFDENNMLLERRRTAYVECNYPTGGPASFVPNSQPVCKKTVQKVNDKIVVSRSCAWTDVNDPPKKCKPMTTNPSYVETRFCETCSTDGCNGAAEYGPIAAFILIPIAIARVFSL